MEVKIMLSIILFIIGYITWETIKYNKQKKEHERINQECARKSTSKKQKPRSCAKAAKVKAPYKGKSKRIKKKM